MHVAVVAAAYEKELVAVVAAYEKELVVVVAAAADGMELAPLAAAYEKAHFAVAKRAVFPGFAVVGDTEQWVLLQQQVWIL